MSSHIQQALGADFIRLAPVLQAHYGPGRSREIGTLDIEFAPAARPVLRLLSLLGALVSRSGLGVETVVDKVAEGQRQAWRRRLRYADGQTLAFDSLCEAIGPGLVLEWVNAVLGLRMSVWVEGSNLRYQSAGYVVRLGPWYLVLPEWMGLGQATIEERPLDGGRYAMDFRLRHPVLGQWFRYAGEFCIDVGGGV